MIPAVETILDAAPEGWRIDLTRKNIRHIYFRVDPGRKRVRISAPRRIGDRRLDQAVTAKSHWILKQMGRSPERPGVSPEFETMDITWFRGQSFSFLAAEASGPAGVILETKPPAILVHIRPGSPATKVLQVLDQWYREELRADIRKLLTIWEPRIGVRTEDFGVRRMKTRWGSCNIRARRIWINLALIRLDPVFLEYVVVHELVHLLEPGHNARFYGFMERFLPGWKTLKRQLDTYRLR